MVDAFGTGGTIDTGSFTDGSIVRIGTEGEGDTDCTPVGDPDGGHFVANGISYDYAGGYCTWGLGLDREEGAKLQVTGVYAYGYGDGVSAPIATPDPDYATFSRDDGSCDHGLIPAALVATPDKLATQCFDVAVGNSDNSNFYWIGHSGVYDDGMGDIACMQDCNGGTTCSDACNAYGAKPACDGTYKMTQPTEGYSCADYGPVGIDVQGKDVGTDGAESGAADVASGSGTFMLFPIVVGDYNADGDFHARLVPIQLSGTGKPTRSAHLTAISSVTIPSGASLFLLHEGTDSFKWTHDDNLVDAGSIATAITGAVTLSSPTPRAPGVFVAKGIAGSDLDDFRVTMSWTAGTNSGPTLPQGWSFELQDIGCSTYVQSFTIRHLTSPERVVIQPYGVPGEGFTFPATSQTYGDSFDFTMASLHVAGELHNMSSNGATLVLNTLTYQGSNICSTGTYSLDPE